MRGSGVRISSPAPLSDANAALERGVCLWAVRDCQTAPNQIAAPTDAGPHAHVPGCGAARLRDPRDLVAHVPIADRRSRAHARAGARAGGSGARVLASASAALWALRPRP